MSSAKWVLTAFYAVGSQRVRYVCTHPIIALASFVSCSGLHETTWVIFASHITNMLHVVAISAAGCCRTPSGNIAELGGIPRIKGRETLWPVREKGLAVRAFSLARVDSGFRREQGDDPSLRNLRDLHTCITAICLPCLAHSWASIPRPEFVLTGLGH